ncbi:MAG: Sigma-70, region 4, partial [Myxococcaceae bacterium]|nr:Sigma-70, region 4 [Myxococcaceae bacterium]
DAALDARQRRAQLTRAAAALSAREQQMLAMHYEEGQTFREIGLQFGVTESRVSQLHLQAIRRMRATIAA